MSLRHRRQRFAFAIFLVTGGILLAWITTYVQARSDSVSSGCWGPPVRTVVLPPALPESTCVAFAPLARIDGWVSGEYVEVISARILP